GGNFIGKRPNPDAKIDLSADLDRRHINRRDVAQQGARLVGVLLGLEGPCLDDDALGLRLGSCGRLDWPGGGGWRRGGPPPARPPAELGRARFWPLPG